MVVGRPRHPCNPADWVSVLSHISNLNLFLNLRIVAIINIYAGVNAMKTLRRSIPNG